MYAGFLTDRHWTVVRNLKLRRALLIVQLKASSILVQFIENNRNKVPASSEMPQLFTQFLQTNHTILQYLQPPRQSRVGSFVLREVQIAKALLYFHERKFCSTNGPE